LPEGFVLLSLARQISERSKSNKNIKELSALFSLHDVSIVEVSIKDSGVRKTSNPANPFGVSDYSVASRCDFTVAFATIDRPVVSRLEGHLCVLTTLSTHYGKHLAAKSGAAKAIALRLS